MATEAQIAANRLNALKSTGPRTDEGKRRSRANALKHGLCASELVPEDLQAVQQRARDCFFGLKPQDGYQAWLVNDAAVLSLRIDRCRRSERRVRDKIRLKALLTWDDDKRLEARVLANRLAANPSEVAEVLRRTPHGCDWLIEQWSLLAGAARTSDAWTAEQTKLAFDLLGTPHAFRQGRQPGAVLDREGNVVESPDDRLAVCRRQVEELERRREIAAEIDEVERHLAESDLVEGTDPELKRLRRYESAIHRQIRWNIAQLKDPTPHKRTQDDLCPTWEVEPAPKTEEEVAAEHWTPDRIHPPFDLEPDEYPPPGQVADVPAIVASRKQKRLAKADSRRESRRRKLDKLRA